MLPTVHKELVIQMNVGEFMYIKIINDIHWHKGITENFHQTDKIHTKYEVM